MMKNAKHDQKAHDNSDEPAEHVLEHCRVSEEGGREFAKEYKQLDSRITNLKSVRSKRTTASEPLLTQDQIEQNEEDNTTEAWQRKGGSKEAHSVLRKNLLAAFTKKKLLNNVARFADVQSWVSTQEKKKTKFMSYPLFNAFMNQRRTTKFKADQVSYLDGHIEAENKTMEIPLLPEEEDQATNATAV
jgi:hypothetical protein